MASTVMKIIKPNFISQMARAVHMSKPKEKSWKVLKLNHIAVATPDLGKATTLYQEILGMKTSESVAQPDHGVYTKFVECGNTNLELLSIYGEKSPISPFLSKNKSGGIHHICLEVDNIKAAMEDLKKNNIRLLSEETKIGAHGKPVIFLHPKDCAGVLIELEEV